MKKAILTRRGIPFFYKKSEDEFRFDVYEKYDQMVIRQTALHLADELWNEYPFQPVFDFFKENAPLDVATQIAEIGCGVGRMIGSIANQFPNLTAWGVDYSYQMLRQAKQHYISNQSIILNKTESGLPKLEIKGAALNNINFGLARAEELPFEDKKLDVVFSSFLLDRLDAPIQGLKEMHRVLKPNGKLLIVSPLNFQQKEHWDLLFPIGKLLNQIENLGFNIQQSKQLIVKEPLDINGNFIQWNCSAISATKK